MTWPTMTRQIASAVIILLVSAASEWSGFLQPIDNQLSALRMSAQPRAPTGQVVVVDIDAKSIEAVGSWPWQRRVHARLIDRLVEYGATEIAIDIDFSNRSNAFDDAQLEAALERAGGVVILASHVQGLTADAGATAIHNRPLERFARHAWVGSATVRQDRDGKVRRFPFGMVVDGEIVPSMPFMLAGGLGQAGTDFLIDFSIDVRAIDRISVIDVLRGAIDGSRISGKKVIVGAQAAELRDFFNVPAAGMISGAMLEAVATETLLQNRILHEAHPVAAIAGLLFIALGALAIGRVRWPIFLGLLCLTAILVESTGAVAQSAYAVDVETASLNLAIVLLAFIVLICEIDFRKVAQKLWRIRAENAEAVLTQVVADSFAGVAVVDENGRIRSASRAAAAILGTGHKLDNLTIAEVFPAELTTRVNAAFVDLRCANIKEIRGELQFGTGSDSDRILEYVITLSHVTDVSSVGETRPESARFACVTFSDATEQRAAATRINYMARFDPLTELPNRNALVERLEAAIAAPVSEKCRFALVRFDIDDLQHINNTVGHECGDLVLKAFAERAKEIFGDDVFRFGSDEFAAVVFGDDAERIAADDGARLIARIGEAFRIKNYQLMVSACAGITAVAADDSSPDDVLRRADMALHRAKTDGGIAVFEKAMFAAVIARQSLERDLSQAIDRGQCEVWYQPQFNLQERRLVGVEALLRWRHPTRGLVTPDEFIPVAEAIGLIDALGTWVLETACRAASGWPASLKLAVNVSSAQFARCDMVRLVSQALTRSGLAASRLDLEITESLFMQPSDTLHSTLDRLCRMGVGMVLDDFGTGFSSLSYIHKYPIRKIKIDRSFVAGLPADRESSAIVRAIISLAKQLDIRLNAEGIETHEQAEYLNSLGIDEGQGYLFGRPLPAADFELAAAEIGQGFKAVPAAPRTRTDRLPTSLTLAG